MKNNYLINLIGLFLFSLTLLTVLNCLQVVRENDRVFLIEDPHLKNSAIFEVKSNGVIKSQRLLGQKQFQFFNFVHQKQNNKNKNTIQKKQKNELPEGFKLLWNDNSHIVVRKSKIVITDDDEYMIKYNTKCDDPACPVIVNETFVGIYDINSNILLQKIDIGGRNIIKEDYYPYISTVKNPKTGTDDVLLSLYNFILKEGKQECLIHLFDFNFKKNSNSKNSILNWEKVIYPINCTIPAQFITSYSTTNGKIMTIQEYIDTSVKENFQKIYSMKSFSLESGENLGSATKQEKDPNNKGLGSPYYLKQLNDEKIAMFNEYQKTETETVYYLRTGDENFQQETQERITGTFDASDDGLTIYANNFVEKQLEKYQRSSTSSIFKSKWAYPIDQNLKFLQYNHCKNDKLQKDIIVITGMDERIGTDKMMHYNITILNVNDQSRIKYSIKVSTEKAYTLQNALRSLKIDDSCQKMVMGLSYSGFWWVDLIGNKDPINFYPYDDECIAEDANLKFQPKSNTFFYWVKLSKKTQGPAGWLSCDIAQDELGFQIKN